MLKSKVKSNGENKISSEIVKKIIKDWIIDQTFLIKIYSFLDKRAYHLKFSAYTKEGNKKMMINLIKGNNKHIPTILEKIDQQINILDLSDFNKEEIKSLKQFLKELNNIENEKLEKYYLNAKNKKDKISKEKDKIKMLLDKNKFNQIFRIKISTLFRKYLSKKYLIKRILKDIIIIISYNFCWICYFFMILNHMINASIISLFYPISIFCYSLLENPRPSKNYWKLCYIYTFIILILKCFSQKIFLGSFLNLDNKDENDPDNAYQNLKIFLDHYPIGIKLYDDYEEYYLNLILDYLVLITLIINKNILMLNAKWTLGT